MRNSLLIVFFLIIASSCNRDDVIFSTPPPIIHIDNQSGIFTTKCGREIIISPTYDFVEGASFEWIIDGKVVATTPSYTFITSESGEYYLTISVKTEYGSDSEELRVDVLEREIPTISIGTTSTEYTIAQYGKLLLTSSVRECSIPTTLSWKVNGVEVSKELSYTFVAEELGIYQISFSAENEDGSDLVEFTIIVCEASQIPFNWSFERTDYHLSSSRRIRIAPLDVTNGENVSYQWALNGVDIDGATSSALIFDKEEIGKYSLTLTASIQHGEGTYSLFQQFEVEVFPKEGTYKRTRNASSLAAQTTVFEFTPAPGQFVNELKTAGFTIYDTTPEAAVEYAKKRMEQNLFVSLGGFGGYLIVGFDHSIENGGGYDFAVTGNSFDGSSEPGIVWVMQDENGNGLPDDNWYELKGSEEGHPETIKNYAVTYYRPAAPNMPVRWTDNLGQSGEIDYLVAYHPQDYYYPLWIKEDSYTLRGTRLQARNYDRSGNGTYWIQPAYDWGYVDNFSQIDRLDLDTSPMSNHFKISNAIDWEGKPVNLQYVDFIKIQTALNTKSGWLGENSTEVFGFYDYHITKGE